MIIGTIIKLSLQVLIAAFGFAAAGWWYRAAKLAVPAPIAYFDETPDDDPFLVATRLSARYNAKAALCAAISALLAAVLAGGDVGAAWLSR